MSPTTYADVLAKNMRAARSRADLQQEPLAARMRALGYSAWRRQTVANVEKGKRGVSAEEIFALAEALETTIAALMAPQDEDTIVDFPSGAEVSVAHVQLSAHGVVDRAVRWDGDVPTFPAPSTYAPPWTGDATAPAVQAIQKARRRLAWESLPADEQQQRLADSAALAAGGLPAAVAGEPGRIPMEPLPRPAPQPVIAAIVTSDRGVLVTRRVDGKPPWGFVTGWSEPGESPADTIIREAKEEADLRVKVGERIGERPNHPDTGAHMVYYAATPTHGTEISLGDKAELLEVRWVSLAEADELLPGMHEPVREYLARELGER